MREYKSIRDNILETKAGEPSTTYPEKNDLIIVKAIRDFQESNHGCPKI